MFRRLVIKGSSGAGKSTLARALSCQLELPHIELDALHHGVAWSAASAQELSARVLAALDDERGWVVDGNYDSKLGPLVLDRADLVVWLDLPLRTKLARLARRSARRWLTGQELWNGNRETLSGLLWGTDALFAWAVRTHYFTRREWPRQLAGRPLVRLRAPSDVDAWLATIGAQSRA